jgi:hypothetical protein
MPTAPEPESQTSRAPMAVGTDDAAGQLLAAMLAAAGVTRPVAEPALAETG